MSDDRLLTPAEKRLYNKTFNERQIRPGRQGKLRHSSGSGARGRRRDAETVAGDAELAANYARRLAEGKTLSWNPSMSISPIDLFSTASIEEARRG